MGLYLIIPESLVFIPSSPCMAVKMTGVRYINPVFPFLSLEPNRSNCSWSELVLSGRGKIAVPLAVLGLYKGIQAQLHKVNSNAVVDPNTVVSMEVRSLNTIMDLGCRVQNVKLMLVRRNE